MKQLPVSLDGQFVILEHPICSVWLKDYLRIPTVYSMSLSLRGLHSMKEEMAIYSQSSTEQAVWNALGKGQTRVTAVQNCLDVGS